MAVQIQSVEKLLNTTPVANGAAGAQQMAQGAAQAHVTVETGMKPVAKATEEFSKASNEAIAFGRGNLEAMTQATQAYLAGMQAISRQYVASVQGFTQHAIEGAKTLAGVKSLKDAMAVQASLTRVSIERALGEGAKLQQAALKVTEQVYAPLTHRTTEVLEQTKLSRPT